MNEMNCPWCKEPIIEETIYPEGIRKCSRCKKIFAFERHIEVTFVTYKIRREK